ncbi:GCN5-related N-acetyltransferase [Desulfobacca acetoxidans DSM 11109]|uniref:GCN5-related N-acetyltransferase n=2 Tax=Desulfobacca acetoxidans TaxID=60893 RepID=F2NDY3_DESAR|nr:GCN5-related N-acetyltransferase [Desulfobacca acetoxidans DSM 11109]HAY23362.1 N-acetyltransferase [Desulfobacterales bacterium]
MATGLIRKARIADINAIRKILQLFAAKGELLARTMAELYSLVRDYYVYQEDHNSPVIGVSALHVCWEALGEVRSVAVLEQYQRRGVGARLVETCLSEAITLGLERVFVLTYRPDFFARFGFEVVDKNILPHIVWADCVRCPKFPECDEIAMLLKF